MKVDLAIRNWTFLIFMLIFYICCFLYTLHVCLYSKVLFMESNHILILVLFFIGFITFILNLFTTFSCSETQPNFNHSLAYLYTLLLSIYIVFIIHISSFILVEMKLVNNQSHIVMYGFIISFAIVLFLAPCPVLKHIEKSKNMNTDILDESVKDRFTTIVVDYDSRDFRPFWKDSGTNYDSRYQNRDTNYCNVHESPYPWANAQADPHYFERKILFKTFESL